MAKETGLTVEKALEILHTQLLLRVLVTIFPRQPRTPVETTISLLSLCADEDGNRNILNMRSTFREPTREYSRNTYLHIGSLGVREQEWVDGLGHLFNSAEEGSLWQSLPSSKPLLATLREKLPPRCADTRIHEVDPTEPHLLQNLVRFQTLLAKTIAGGGHHWRYYLSSVYYRLSALIEQQNRELERTLGLAIRTPER